MERTNVDAFVKPSVNDAGICLFGIAHKTILAAFPRGRFFAVVIALDVLVKIGTAAGKDRIVVRWQRQIDSRRFGLRENARPKRDRSDRNHNAPADHFFFFSPMSRQSFFIRSMSALVRPEAM